MRQSSSFFGIIRAIAKLGFYLLEESKHCKSFRNWQLELRNYFLYVSFKSITTMAE